MLSSENVKSSGKFNSTGARPTFPLCPSWFLYICARFSQMMTSGDHRERAVHVRGVHSRWPGDNFEDLSTLSSARLAVWGSFGIQILSCGDNSDTTSGC